MNDDETQIALGLIELAMMQKQANVISMQKQLQTMVSDGRAISMLNVSKNGDLTLTPVSEIELGGAS